MLLSLRAQQSPGEGREEGKGAGKTTGEEPRRDEDFPADDLLLPRGWRANQRAPCSSSSFRGVEGMADSLSLGGTYLAGRGTKKVQHLGQSARKFLSRIRENQDEKEKGKENFCAEEGRKRSVICIILRRVSYGLINSDFSWLLLHTLPTGESGFASNDAHDRSCPVWLRDGFCWCFDTRGGGGGGDASFPSPSLRILYS